MVSTEDIKSALILANTLSELLGQSKAKPKVAISSSPTASGGGGTPSDTVVTEKAYGQSEAAGVATPYSRGDHTHGTPPHDTTKLDSPLAVNTIDQTGSREDDVTYHNTTGQALRVSVSAGGLEGTLYLLIGNSSVMGYELDIDTADVEYGHGKVSGIVPVDWYYKTQGAMVITKWIEQTLG